MSTHEASVSIEREWAVGEATRRVSVTVRAPSLNALDHCRKVAVEAIEEAGAGVEGFQVRRV